VNRVADVCILLALVVTVLLGASIERHWSPKRYFRTWIGILVGTLVVCLVSVELVILFGNPRQVWIFAWLLFD